MPEVLKKISSDLRTYRVVVAIIFGLIGFGINFLDIEFMKGATFKISILAGLFFPLVVALAWGWRYGLLSALAGGTQTMWWLWYGDGWGVLYSVPVFTLWIVWHGWWAGRRSEGHPWYIASFAVEVPFRIVIELGFIVVFRWLVSLNPPPWNPAVSWDHVSSAWLLTVAIKHTVTAYVLLMAAYVALSLGPVRRFFKQLPRPAQRDTTAIYAGAALFGLLLWLLDAFVQYAVFPFEGQTFWGIAVHGASAHEVFMRSVYIAVAMLAGILLARLNRRRVELQENLDHRNRVLAAIRNVNQLIVREKDPHRLLDEACRLLVENQGYYNVWIILTADGRPVKPFFHVGFNGSFAPMTEQLCAGELPVCAKAALSSGEVYVEDDPSVQCVACPLALSYAGRAGLSLRLEHEGRVFGWLSLSCPARFAHNAEEHDLLKEVTGDISFALWAIETKAQQETLEGKYAAVLAGTNDAVVAVDLDGSITVFNPGAEKLLGYPADEVMGLPITRFCPEDRLDEQTEKIRRVREIGVITGYETERLTAEGQRIPVEITLNLNTDDSGRPLGINAILRDITERKQAEKEREKLQVQLSQAQKMESIGSLAGGIAHDFNNLLSPIVGLSEMMMDDFPCDSLEHQNLHQIFQAGKRGSDLVQHILSFSRQSKQQLIPVQIPTVLKDVFKLCRATIPTYIPITRDIQSNCRPVMADPIQIHQIAMNLITNAYHAVEPGGGTISIQLAEMDVDQECDPVGSLAPGRYAMLSVSDTGAGIDPAVINKIFDPYFTTKEKGRGTGLGLATVYGIVKSYGGEIRVHSVIGKGTTFHVYLPQLEKSQKSEPEKETTPIPTGTEHILVVDDEISLVHLEEQMLERLGYQTTCFTGSMDALAAFRDDPTRFDIVLTDMNMPHLNGLQLAKELIAVRPDIPVIICTGFSERIDKIEAEDLGISGLLMKPMGMKDLSQKIRDVLKKRKK